MPTSYIGQADENSILYVIQMWRYLFKKTRDKYTTIDEDSHKNNHRCFNCEIDSIHLLHF